MITYVIGFAKDGSAGYGNIFPLSAKLDELLERIYEGESMYFLISEGLFQWLSPFF